MEHETIHDAWLGPQISNALENEMKKRKKMKTCARHDHVLSNHLRLQFSVAKERLRLGPQKVEEEAPCPKMTIVWIAVRGCRKSPRRYPKPPSTKSHKPGMDTFVSLLNLRQEGAVQSGS